MRDRTTADPATRLDEELGLVEEAGFLGASVPRLFTVAYRPTRPAVGAVVICPAVLSEYDHSYSIDVAFARGLAARGFLVHRFHYRGTGHSDGQPEDMTFETMREDALAATAWLAGELGGREPVVVGLRLGGLVAASVAAAHSTAPLVLWEPAIDGRSYFREAWRADMMFRINEGSSSPATRDALPALLARDGQVDVLGYPICADLYESTVARSLAVEVGERTRKVLVVRGGPVDAPRPPLERTVEELVARGCNVDVEVLRGPIVWWFQGPEMRRNARPQVADLIARTLSWVQANGGAEAVA